MTLTIYLNDRISSSKDCSSIAMLVYITVVLVWHHALNLLPRKTREIHTLCPNQSTNTSYKLAEARGGKNLRMQLQNSLFYSKRELCYWFSIAFISSILQSGHCKRNWICDCLRMSDIVQSRIHGGCSSTICYCFAAVKAKAALAGTGRTIEQTLLLYGCISLLLFSLVVFPYICMYICITDKYFNVWERYIKEKKVSDIQMALGINHFMALRFSVCRKESGLSSPRTRQQSPTKLCLRKLHPAESRAVPVFLRFNSVAVPISQNSCWKSFRTGSKHSAPGWWARQFPEEKRFAL